MSENLKTIDRAIDHLSRRQNRKPTSVVFEAIEQAIEFAKVHWHSSAADVRLFHEGAEWAACIVDEDGVVALYTHETLSGAVAD